MFELNRLWEDSNTLKCHLNKIGLISENNLESLRCEKFIIIHFMALSACDQLCVSLVNSVLLL